MGSIPSISTISYTIQFRVTGDNASSKLKAMKQKKCKENLDEIVSLLCSNDSASHQIALGLIKPLKAHTAKLVDKWVSKALVVHIADASNYTLPLVEEEGMYSRIATAFVLGKEFWMTLIEEWTKGYSDNAHMLTFKSDVPYMTPNRYTFAVAGWYERGTSCAINPNFKKECKAA